jgi:uncharacterized protein
MKIAVIIPTLNEAAALPATLAAIGDGCDIWIADGGSHDASCAIALEAGAQVISTAPPRAQQLNAAAQQCNADIVLFLHADTQLPGGWQHEVLSILQTPNVVLGAFSLAIANSNAGEAWIARATNWRSRVRQLPYGDQSLFLYRRTFKQLGGFPVVPIMDDYLFVKAAQKRGRIRTSALAVTTSNRRWRKLGVWQTCWRNFCVVLGYHLGVPLDALQRYYRR